MTTTIQDNLQKVMARIQAAAARCGRSPEEIRLVAVGKTHPPDALQAAIDAGASILGENYIQEARTKFDALIDQSISWHFIGRLQSNKAKYAVRMFDLIHTVDSLKLAAELDQQARKAGKVQAILIQVNISGETTKAGVGKQETLALVQQVRQMNHLRIKGFMTMPPFFDAPEKARPFFAALRKLRNQINAQAIPNIDMQELSMGMTGDFETAIEEGATLVRIGTAIFGGRA